MKIKKKQKLAKEWFIKLQNIVCNNVEQLEKEYGSSKKFKKKKWKHGELRIIKGEVIEKGGVAFSNVIGKFPKEFAKKIPGTKNNTNFWSSGVSVVFHPKNPKIPAMHFNTRFICTKKNWFGGGMDLTPCIVDNKEKKYFHCPAFASKVVDKVGAGDAMLSIISILLKTKFKNIVALFMGSIAGALSVEEMSNKVPINRVRLLKYFNHILK